MWTARFLVLAFIWTDLNRVVCYNAGRMDLSDHSPGDLKPNLQQHQRVCTFVLNQMKEQIEKDIAEYFEWNDNGMVVACVFPECNQSMFSMYVETCLMIFNKSMESSGYQDKCSWPTEKPIYYKLKRCVDISANETWCKGQGFHVDNVFLEVHQKYFSSCENIQDPPLFTLIMLITPATIATLFMPLLCVHLVTREKGTLGMWGL